MAKPIFIVQLPRSTPGNHCLEVKQFFDRKLFDEYNVFVVCDDVDKATFNLFSDKGIKQITKEEKAKIF